MIATNRDFYLQNFVGVLLFATFLEDLCFMNLAEGG